MLYSIHPSFWKVISEVIVSIQVFAIIIVGLSFSTAVHVLNFKVQNEILLGVIFAINFNQNQTIQYMYEVEQKKVFDHAPCLANVCLYEEILYSLTVENVENC